MFFEFITHRLNTNFEKYYPKILYPFLGMDDVCYQKGVYKIYT